MSNSLSPPFQLKKGVTLLQALEGATVTQHLFIVCGLGFLVRLFFSFYSHDMMYIDEVNFYLDPAVWNHYRIGSLPPGETVYFESWPVRSPLPILLLQAMLGVSDFFNIHAPLDQIIVIRIFLSLWSLLGIVSVYHLTLALYPGQKGSAFLTALVTSLWGYVIYANMRTLGECMSLPSLLCGFWLFYAGLRPTTRTPLILAGLMMGLSVAFKVQSGLFLIGMGLYGWYHKHVKALLYVGVGFLIMLTVQGVVDLWTYGTFLQSLIGYIQFQLFENADLVTRHDPPLRVVQHLFKLHFPLLFPFMVYFTCKDFKRNALMTISVMIYIAFHVYHPVKDARYLVPVMPFFLLMFLGAFLTWGTPAPTLKKVIGGIIVVALASQFLSVPFPSMFRPEWRRNANYFFAQAYVGQQADSTGLLMYNVRWLPLMFYIRKNIPVTQIYPGVTAQDIENYHAYNYLIVRSKDKSGNPVRLQVGPQIQNDFDTQDQPVKTFGDHEVYQRKTVPGTGGHESGDTLS